jgi:hypothetical protein
MIAADGDAKGSQKMQEDVENAGAFGLSLGGEA